MLDGKFAERLAVQTWAWQDGATGSVLTWLQQLGCNVLSRPEPGRTWCLAGIAGSNATLSIGDDPIATASAIGFLCAGIFWPEVFPGLLVRVNTEWARRSRAQRQHRSGASPSVLSRSPGVEAGEERKIGLSSGQSPLLATPAEKPCY